MVNALSGLADVKVIMYLSAVTYFLIAIPAGYFFGFIVDMKIAGIWLAYPIGFFFACGAFYLRFRRFTKKIVKGKVMLSLER